MQLAVPVHARQLASQEAQAASLVAVHMAVWYSRAPQVVQVPHVVSCDPMHATVWNWPVGQVEHAVQTVSLVGVQAAVWYVVGPQLEQRTQALPTRWKPATHAVQLLASVHVAQPSGQAVQAVSATAVQADF